MKNIFLLFVENGQDYGDHREWPWVFVDDRESAEKLVRQTNECLQNLFQRAQEHAWKTDYKKTLLKSAPGKRYVKFLKDKGLVHKKEKHVSLSLHQVSFCSVPEATT